MIGVSWVLMMYWGGCLRINQEANIQFWAHSGLKTVLVALTNLAITRISINTTPIIITTTEP